ncbi:MAG: hypothetical protein M1840_003047 [Geoglossum simile]|nr:MAG: hypothetical protein M1840_003047 [Geoglossum simile]
MQLYRSGRIISGIELNCSFCVAEVRRRKAAIAQQRLSCRYNTTKANPTPKTITIDGGTYPTDSWTNIPESIISTVSRRLHLQPTHPISLTRQIIESRFPSPVYEYHNALFPVVSVEQNFDSLDFPADHPGRSKTDTYYANKDNVLRTHTSAHQVDMFRANKSLGFLISADVYRRDAIDRSHYPAFHQMEGARLWCREGVPGGNVAKGVWEDIQKLPSHGLAVEDPNPTTHPERNPLQTPYHKQEEVEAIAAHLKRSLEGVVVEIFSKARETAIAAGEGHAMDPEEPLRVRWVEAYFPFTSPSWELEVFWQGDWLEILGCGVIKQDILTKSGVPNRVGWAFGLGLERIAMLLFSIPDIRLFWSHDPRFLSQFSACTPTSLTRFIPFSKHPSCYKDVSFWLPSGSTNSAGGLTQAASFHENDVMEILRDIAGDLVEDVRLVDEFVQPSTGRKSLCYRINFRSLERTLTNKEINGLQMRVRETLVGKLGVELR